MVQWRECIGSEPLGHIESMPIKNGLLGIVNGHEVKLVETTQGKISGTVNISQPLPQKW